MKIDMHDCRFYDSQEDPIEKNPLQVHCLREQILANARVAFMVNGDFHLITGVDPNQEDGVPVDIRFAHLFRRYCLGGQQYMAFILIVRGLNDKCPLLGMQRYLEEMVYETMDSDIVYDAARDWNGFVDTRRWLQH
ncbi:uncharacterized protein N7496_005344 [Penicillium cataractarum]|uniref:Uncharacterized protein n=1 Tax=Penicillium cataractarum TaxID=2100454 RepID=A0A9W9VFU5_9EURO|nr:uncharacterized protein N7496_005344 [Penicillium cataractarum]KAJ5377935.1 hypothetical protein N7496_005344 [Penicillium cataractarum]